MGLSEIRINRPGQRINITRSQYPEQGRIKLENNDWLKKLIGEHGYFKYDKYINVVILNKYIYIGPGFEEEESHFPLKNLFDSMGIKNLIVKRGTHYWIKVPNTQYKIINNNLNENNKMTKKDIKNIIQEEIRNMFEPQRAPSRPSVRPEREVEIMEPGEKEETRPRRRTLTPPEHSPSTKPKALMEDDIVDKISQRFKKLTNTDINEIRVNRPGLQFTAQLIDVEPGEYISYDIEYKGVTAYGECYYDNPNDKEGYVRVPISQDDLDEREELMIFADIPNIEHVSPDGGYTENFYIPFDKIKFEHGESPSELQNDEQLNEIHQLQKRAGL